MAARSSSLAWTALVGSGVLYGYNWVVMKSALRYENSATFAASRVFGGAVFLFLLLLVLRKPLRPTNWLLTMVVWLFGMTGSIGLTIWALASGGAGKTSPLVYSMPVWLLLMSWIILGERMRGAQWISIVVALVGLLLVISPWKPEGTGLSNLLGVAAGVCSAASAVAAKRLFRDRRVDLLNNPSIGESRTLSTLSLLSLGMNWASSHSLGEWTPMTLLIPRKAAQKKFSRYWSRKYSASPFIASFIRRR